MGQDKLQILFRIICSFRSRLLLLTYFNLDYTIQYEVSYIILIFVYNFLPYCEQLFSPGIEVSFINFSDVILFFYFFPISDLTYARSCYNCSKFLAYRQLSYLVSRARVTFSPFSLSDINFNRNWGWRSSKIWIQFTTMNQALKT